MSVLEAYIRASRSSHLEWLPTVGDVDRLTAAGLVKETLATRLIRLRAEFDALSVPTGAAPRYMMHMLRGLPTARTHLVAFAKTEAASRRNPPSDDDVLDIVARVLDLFLDPNCAPCDGRGYTGAYGSPQIRCSTCRESGKRWPRFKTDEHEEFGRWLQARIDGKTSRAIDEMRKLLRTR